jgi:hypothetical protein
MPTPVPYARAVNAAQSFKTYGSQAHCCVPEEKPTCHRFSVGKDCVCLTLWGMEGRLFTLNKLRLDDACKVIGGTAYPLDCPFISSCEGVEVMITKPGDYQICAVDGEPLGDNFSCDFQRLSSKQSLALSAVTS